MSISTHTFSPFFKNPLCLFFRLGKHRESVQCIISLDAFPDTKEHALLLKIQCRADDTRAHVAIYIWKICWFIAARRVWEGSARSAPGGRKYWERKRRVRRKKKDLVRQCFWKFILQRGRLQPRHSGELQGRGITLAGKYPHFAIFLKKIRADNEKKYRIFLSQIV